MHCSQLCNIGKLQYIRIHFANSNFYFYSDRQFENKKVWPVFFMNGWYSTNNNILITWNLSPHSVAGVLFDCLNQECLLSLSLLLTAVGTAAAPWSTNYIVLMSLFACQGVSMGFLDTGQYSLSWIIRYYFTLVVTNVTQNL